MLKRLYREDHPCEPVGCRHHRGCHQCDRPPGVRESDSFRLCDPTATIANCCCHDRGDGSTQGGPVETKVQVNPNLTVALAVFAPIDFSQPHGTIARPHTSAPFTNPLDHPTLFASLPI